MEHDSPMTSLKFESFHNRHRERRSRTHLILPVTVVFREEQKRINKPEIKSNQSNKRATTGKQNCKPKKVGK